MIDSLLQLDRNLLLHLNGIHSPFWDTFFWIFTATIVWIPFYITLLIALFYRQKANGVWTLAVIILVILFCDQLASTIFKETFERLRPSHEPALDGMVRLLNGKRGGLYGFISSHAANSFGLAMFTTLLFRKWYYTITVFGWAALNSYSRIYMGLHYPADIAGGLLAGIVGGLLFYWLYRRFVWHHIKGFKEAVSFNREVLIPTAGILFSTFMIALCAKVTLNI